MPPVASPCVEHCKIVLRTGHCRGCGRTLEEITNWRVSDDAERLAILARLPARLAAMTKAEREI
jgi:hypothetical protein